MRRIRSNGSPVWTGDRGFTRFALSMLRAACTVSNLSRTQARGLPRWRCGSSSRSGRRWRDRSPAFNGPDRGAEHELHDGLLPRPNPLGNAINEQVGDVVFRQIAASELLTVRPQPLADQQDCGAPQPPPALVPESFTDAAHARAVRQKLTTRHPYLVRRTVQPSCPSFIEPVQVAPRPSNAFTMAAPIRSAAASVSRSPTWV